MMFVRMGGANMIARGLVSAATYHGGGGQSHEDEILELHVCGGR